MKTLTESINESIITEKADSALRGAKVAFRKIMNKEVEFDEIDDIISEYWDVQGPIEKDGTSIEFTIQSGDTLILKGKANGEKFTITDIAVK